MIPLSIPNRVTLSKGKETMDTHLSSAVQMQFLRPGQLEEAMQRFPVVYVPFGLIEWHGPHLPLDMCAPLGIGGLDPREHASVEVGRRNVELAVETIGNKAKALLESLPEDQRSSSLPAVSPEHWWAV